MPATQEQTAPEVIDLPKGKLFECSASGRSFALDFAVDDPVLARLLLACKSEIEIVIPGLANGEPLRVFRVNIRNGFARAELVPPGFILYPRAP
jgi:hypothetical protein